MTTKKVGITGKYGTRYGTKSKKIIRKVEAERRDKNNKCPVCDSKGKLKREQPGIWSCKKCDSRFAGGAYVPQTLVFRDIRRVFKGEASIEEIGEEE